MAKKAETEPISDDEWLYRRAYKDRFRINKLPRVSPTAFEPRIKGNEPDIDGISLYRADCLDDATEILAMIPDPDKRRANGIVKISVAEIKAIGLTIVSTVNENIRGHVSIPELSAENYEDATFRLKCKEWMRDLAEFASIEDRTVLQPET